MPTVPPAAGCRETVELLALRARDERAPICGPIREECVAGPDRGAPKLEEDAAPGAGPREGEEAVGMGAGAGEAL